MQEYILCYQTVHVQEYILCYRTVHVQEYSLSSQLESTDVYFMVYPDGTVLAIPPLHNKVGPGPVIVHQGK